MNKFYVLALGLMIICFSSCQFSENIYINEDGSGKMEFAFDASELMLLAGDKMMEGKEEAVDSVISFKALFEEKKDSIAQLSQSEQERLKALEPFSFHMLMNPETKEMKFDMFTDFNNVKDLRDMFKAMNQVQNLNGKKDASPNPFASLNDGNTQLEYAFDGNVFTRTAIIVDKDKHQESLDNIGKVETMFASSKYKLNYHFPKPIKSVSNENAMFSADRKSITLEFSFMDYVNNPEALNLEVVLEN